MISRLFSMKNRLIFIYSGVFSVCCRNMVFIVIVCSLLSCMMWLCCGGVRLVGCVRVVIVWFFYDLYLMCVCIVCFLMEYGIEIDFREKKLVKKCVLFIW